MICVIHAHFINIAQPGSYEKELNKMLVTNGLPTIRAPNDVPSEELFSARAKFQIQEEDRNRAEYEMEEENEEQVNSYETYQNIWSENTEEENNVKKEIDGNTK